MLPKSMRNSDRIDSVVLPPGSLVANTVHQPMMDATERNRELVTHLTSQRARLQMPQMMRVARLAAANHARLLTNIAQVVTVAMTAWDRNGEHALVDFNRFAGIGGVVSANLLLLHLRHLLPLATHLRGWG